ncbi:diguanylate cyclase (GGDEF) domain-containing protein [Clostridium collagenovorans DSM 3089]|uniref:Diguanylate cyclase (GGDEF) domain-containing protein n=1 Tax=Clostridium collagenovorans DSM 3089 TaxID=1121306 RepID=A0A1M5X419_9CLOT|nr:EAL domain-containing protein [Clostridium collagenovorans]SHH94566.1 diguanylate cyclase (GGDEF) domain-containing protein [Clostridium collagenovorans DSM 3089]
MGKRISKMVSNLSLKEIKERDADKKERDSVSSKDFNKYSVILAVAVSVLMIIACVVYTTMIKDMLNEETQSHLLEVSNQNAVILDSEINSNVKVLEAISNTIAEEEKLDSDKLLNIMKNEADKHAFARMSIVLPNNRAYMSDGMVIDYEGYKNMFKDASAGKSSISDVMYSTIDNKKIIVYAVPIYISGEVKAVLTATSHLDTLEKKLDVPFFEGKGYVYVLRNDGEIILNNRSEEIVSETNKNIFDVIQYHESETLNVLREDFFYGKSGVKRVKSIDGNEKFMGYVPLNNMKGWYSISVVPANVAFSKASSVIKLTIALCSFIMIIGGIFFGYIIRLRNKNKKTIEYLAFKDKVTGFGNLNKFKIETLKLLRKNKDDKYAIIQLDIDKFKYINDVFGYDEGNKVLVHISNVIDSKLDCDEIFGRVNGDVFLVLMKYKEEQDILDFIELLNRDVDNFEDLVVYGYKVTLNYGIYKIVDTTMEINRMIDRANVAAKTLKDNGNGYYCFFNDEIRKRILNEREIENTMHLALKNKEFIPYFQPQYDLQSGKVVGVEALIRWITPEKGLVPPNDFIPIFEKNGFIIELDKYVLEEVCKIIKSWIDRGIEPIMVSINMSRLHLHNINFIDNFEEIIKKYDVPARLIELEITESAVFDNIAIFNDIIDKLKKIGFVISMDDFGSGYSSLNLLKDVTMDILKLDRDFFNKSYATERDKIVVTSIVEMAKQLNMKVVAEGVETEGQVDFLKDINCHMAQGYYFARPMPTEEFEKLNFK